MKEELLKGLTEEQIAKIKACKSQEEVLKLAKEEGIELTDEQLEAVAGGCSRQYITCPKCGGRMYYSGQISTELDAYTCEDCHYTETQWS